MDCAPTGETMSLLKFPEMLEWWMVKLLPTKRKLIKMVGPAIEKKTKIAMPEDEMFDDAERLLQKLADLRELMSKKEIVSIRIVTTPEKIVMKEAKRNFAFLHLYNYNVDAVIVNKIYPEESMKGYFEHWRRIQQEGLQEISESFAGIPCFRLELQKRELRTMNMLDVAGDMIYGDANPDDIFFQDTVFEVDKVEGHYVMKIHLPGVEKQEMEIQQAGDELIIAIKNEHRRFLLPSKLLGKEIVKAKYTSDYLNLDFE